MAVNRASVSLQIELQRAVYRDSDIINVRIQVQRDGAAA